jgi:hypothetical protein
MAIPSPENACPVAVLAPKRKSLAFNNKTASGRSGTKTPSVCFSTCVWQRRPASNIWRAALCVLPGQEGVP